MNFEKVLCPYCGEKIEVQFPKDGEKVLQVECYEKNIRKEAFAEFKDEKCHECQKEFYIKWT